MNKWCIIILVVVSNHLTHSQNNGWTVYTHNNSGLPGDGVDCLVRENSEITWIGTNNGLAEFDGVNWNTWWPVLEMMPVQSMNVDSDHKLWIGNGLGIYWGLAEFDGTDWILYSTSNSSLPSNVVLAIAFDQNGNKWIGTLDGLAKFDGADWWVYHDVNSGLPDDWVTSLSVDENNNIWIGTNYGIAIFDGLAEWTVYNTSNSGLPDNLVSSIITGDNGDIWIGTSDGLARFDGNIWTVYNTSNSGLPYNMISSIALGGNNDIWIGTYSGLAKFDKLSNWTVYNTSNSGLPDDAINCVVHDSSGEIWIGTEGGLAVYDEIIVSVKNDRISTEGFSLYQNYPDPFNPVTKIRFTLSHSGQVYLKVYDLQGNEIKTLVNSYLSAGTHEVDFSGSGLSSGIYFYSLHMGKVVQTKKMILLK